MALQAALGRRRLMMWLGLALAAPLLLVAVGLLLAQHWLAGDGPRQRIEQEATRTLGVALRVQAMEVTVWPLPAVTLRDVELATQPALTVARIDLRPDWLALARREPALASLMVQDAMLPQAGLDALSARLGGGKQGSARGATPGSGAPLPLWLPRKTTVSGLTWVSSKGVASTLDGVILLADDGLPAMLGLEVVRGAWKATKLHLERGPDNGKRWPTWQVELALAGGSVKGVLAAQMAGLAPVEARDWALEGQLETRGVDVPQLTAPSRVLSGRLEASTKLQARAAGAAALLAGLETQTGFTVRGATLHGVDLVKAVQTVGMNRSGETPLDTLAGQVRTRGQAIQLSNLVASSGALSATGQVNVSPARTLDGRISVDIAAGVVGVPLVVGGTLDAPTVTLTRGALVGAAIGTAVMPGVGTGAGAKLGDRLGEGLKGLFGGRK